MIKLFATDLDGTLLNSASEISAKNKKAIFTMSKSGVIPTISTGRMYSATLDYAQQLGLDVPIITYNGALIKSVSGKIYYEGYINPKLVLEIYDFCRKNNFYYQTYYNDKLYYEEYTDKSRIYEQHIGVKGEAIYNKINKLIDNIPKILIITSGNDESDKVATLINETFKGKVHAAKSMLNYVEILSYGVSKASGLEKLAQILDINMNEVMVIGDGNNDIPMMKVAGVSVAMGNAKPEVKQYADIIVTDCDKDGVAEAIYNYVLRV